MYSPALDGGWVFIKFPRRQVWATRIHVGVIIETLFDEDGCVVGVDLLGEGCSLNGEYDEFCSDTEDKCLLPRFSCSLRFVKQLN